MLYLDIWQFYPDKNNKITLKTTRLSLSSRAIFAPTRRLYSDRKRRRIYSDTQFIMERLYYPEIVSHLICTVNCYFYLLLNSF